MTPCLLRRFAPSSRTSVVTRRVIMMPLDGVVLFEFQINVD